MAENLLLAQKAQAAGAPVTCQVYEGMWHDFEEFSQVGIETASFLSTRVHCARRISDRLGTKNATNTEQKKGHFFGVCVQNTTGLRRPHAQRDGQARAAKRRPLPRGGASDQAAGAGEHDGSAGGGRCVRCDLVHQQLHGVSSGYTG
eukprot:COSAG06_NODE_5683_length_3323_cov_2.594913_4_plen_147_part_00